jgi:hypothetical protein
VRLQEQQKILDRLRNDPAYVEKVIRAGSATPNPMKWIFRFEEWTTAQFRFWLIFCMSMHHPLIEKFQQAGQGQVFAFFDQAHRRPSSAVARRSGRDRPGELAGSPHVAGPGAAAAA